MHISIPRLVLAVSALFITLSSISPAHAQSGTISGRIKPVPSQLFGSARAYSLDVEGSFGAAIPSTGKYLLTVPAGAYAVVSTVSGRKKNGKQIDIVRVTGNKKTSIKPRAFSRAGAPPGLRASVGNIQLITPDGKPIKNLDGKPILWDDLIINDLLNAKAPCDIHVYEDRKYGRYGDVLNELKLQASRFSAKKINLKKALGVLKAHAPQYRVSGSIVATPDLDAIVGPISLNITDLRNGNVVWSTQFTGLTGIDEIGKALGESAANALCMPVRVTGTFTGVQPIRGAGFSVDYTWTGAVTFKLKATFASDPNSKVQDIGAYEIETSKILSYNIAGTNSGCTISAAETNLDPDPISTGLFMLYSKPEQQGYRYNIAVALAKVDGALETDQCPDGTSVSPDTATAELETSDSEANYPFTQDPYAFRGTFVFIGTTMNWDFTAGL